jgi:hypothetical protein
MTYSKSPVDGGVGLRTNADEAQAALPSSPSSSALDTLAELQVRRKFYIKLVNKQTNAMKALVRRSLGWKYDEEEADREKTNARAARIVAAAMGGKQQKPEDAEIFASLSSDLATVAAAIDPCTHARHEIEKEMKRIVRTMPIFEWAKSVKGLGELGLAVILAETGDLGGYPKKGHVWKRLGLAPFDGKSYSTWRKEGGLTADQWTEAGYSPRRRAEIYAVISEPLFRANSVAQGPYRAIYDRRREATAIAHDDWTPMHSHMDALRVMTKYLLRDLWREWRRAYRPMAETPLNILPAADNSDAPRGAGQAKHAVPLKTTMMLPDHESNAPQGAGEAVVKMPGKAGSGLPPLKSKKASKDAAKAVPTLSSKTIGRVPSRKSRDAA